MKIKLRNKDKGLSPPKGAFDFRPNRTVDSNPTLSNMKGDYVDIKSRKKRKYYIGGNFLKYKVDYSPVDVSNPTVELPKLRHDYSLPNFIDNNKEEEPKNEPPVYSITWTSNSQELPTSFIDLLKQENINFRISSGFRPGAKTAQGIASNHSKGNADNPGAYDIVPTSGTFDDFERTIYSNPRILQWLEQNNWGSLREDVVQGNMRGFTGTDGKFYNTGATGNHFHFGPDSHAVKWREANKKKYATG